MYKLGFCTRDLRIWTVFGLHSVSSVHPTHHHTLRVSVVTSPVFMQPWYTCFFPPSLRYARPSVDSPHFCTVLLRLGLRTLLRMRTYGAAQSRSRLFSTTCASDICIVGLWISARVLLQRAGRGDRTYVYLVYISSGSPQPRCRDEGVARIQE